MRQSYMPPNFIDKFGKDVYQDLTGVPSSEEEIRLKNPVSYAKAKYKEHLKSLKKKAKKPETRNPDEYPKVI